MVGSEDRKPLVYLAGPYSFPDPVTNTRRAIEFGMGLWHEGKVAVIIPHLSMLAHLVRPMPTAHWYAFDRDLVLHCDAFVRLSGESSGADAELVLARRAGLMIFDLRSESDQEGFVLWLKGLSR